MASHFHTPSPFPPLYSVHGSSAPLTCRAVPPNFALHPKLQTLDSGDWAVSPKS